MNGNFLMYGRDGKRIMQLGDGLVFVYDHTGLTKMYDLSGMGDFTTVYVQKDALGNVRALLDTNGNLVVQYKYDAWGNCKVLNASGAEISDVMHIGHRNPFRYRGYISAIQQGTDWWRGALTGTVLGGIIGAGVGFVLAGAAGGVIAKIGTSFLKAGMKTVFGKLTADLIAMTILGKEMGSIESYMSAFVFGGLIGGFKMPTLAKKLLDSAFYA